MPLLRPNGRGAQEHAIRKILLVCGGSTPHCRGRSACHWRL